MHEYRIDCPRNEASALTGLHNREILRAYEWDLAFWIVSDERDAGSAVSALGRRGGEWEVKPLDCRLSKSDAKRRTADCETIARAGSWMYVFGSHYGEKDGPLDPRRHFVLRFNESLIQPGKKRLHVGGDLVRRPFLFHRMINDAFEELGLDILEPDDEERQQLIQPTVERGEKKRKQWRDLVRPGDSPINIEGSTFLHGGRLLLGLRYPTTAAGNPILVEIEGIDRLFDDADSLPEIVGFRVLANAGSADRPMGVRELDSTMGLAHLVLGNVESSEKPSAIGKDHPEALEARSEHWTMPLQSMEHPVERVNGERKRAFKGSSIEGLALAGSAVWYVRDAEQVVLLATE